MKNTPKNLSTHTRNDATSVKKVQRSNDTEHKRSYVHATTSKNVLSATIPA
jgi:hypothetical protein